MVRRIADEIDGYVVELGTDGRLLALQLDELMAGVERRPRAGHPRLPAAGGRRAAHARRGAGRARRAAATELIDLAAVAKALGYAGAARRWTPRSARAASGCWRRCRGCPAPSSTGWSSTSAACRSCSAASIDDLQAVDGVGEARARSVREGLSRLAESSILERYV